ncbi:MAG: DinB family protein [Blastocatellia bacterium]
MTRNIIKTAALMCALAVLAGSSLPVQSYPPFVRQAKKFGATNCMFCHTKEEGGEGWNDRGKWLMAERDKRKADSIDMEWLAEYKAGGAAPAAAAAPAGNTAAAIPNAEARAKAAKLLNDSMAETIKAIEGLSEAQWNFRAAPEKWSVAQVAEHIMMSEPFLFGFVENIAKMPFDAEWESKTGGKTEALEKGMVDRSKPAKAPEPLTPTGKLAKAEVIAKFKEARAKTLAFSNDTQLPLKGIVNTGPFFTGMSAYQVMLAIPLHNMRHNLQIAEVKANANFPKK